MRLPYRIVRPLARIALKIYFRKIYLTGLENIPKDKPVILAANHPTAFLEPCLLACTLPRPLHFLVRGDFFQKELHRQLLESLHMMPIYRLKDLGLKGVKNNYSALDRAYELLAQNKMILILAEGKTEHEKRLRPIQKGTARMAIGAIEKYPHLEVQIVPIGVNYSDVLNFRSDVMLDIGQAMDIRFYLTATPQHSAKTIKQITTDLKNQLEQQVVIIQEISDETLTEQLFQLAKRKTRPFPIQIADKSPLKRQKSIANRVNSMNHEEKQAIKVQVDQFFKKLSALNLQPESLQDIKKPTIFYYFKLVVGYIPFLLGYFVNLPPLYFGHWWAENKVEEVVFYASIKASFALAAYLILGLLLLLIALLIGSPYFYIGLLAIPLLGLFSLYFWEFKQEGEQQAKIAKLDPTTIKQLIQEKGDILKRFSEEI